MTSRSQCYDLVSMEHVWVVNTITLEDISNADHVAALQQELVSRVKSKWPGFISQETLVATDGQTVVTVEVWENIETLKAVAADTTLRDYRMRIQQYATLSPVLYRRVGPVSHWPT